MYWHLVCELLYNIEWPSIRRLCIGIFFTYWHFVRALPYSMIESTQSPWYSGSWIDISKIIYSNLCMCLHQLFQRSLGTPRTFADSVHLCRAWRTSSITIMVTPGEGLQMKVTGLNLWIQTPSIFSSPPS